MLHCWEGINQASFFMGELGDTDEARLLEDNPGVGSFTCLCERGHAGPHEWTPDGQILISFAPHEEERS